MHQSSLFEKCVHNICYWYWYNDLFHIYWCTYYYFFIELFLLLLLANFVTFAQLTILQIAHFIILSEIRWWCNSHVKSAIRQLQRTTMQFNVTTASYGCALEVIKLTYKHIGFYKKSSFAWYCIKCFEDIIPFSTISDNELSQTNKGKKEDLRFWQRKTFWLIMT